MKKILGVLIITIILLFTGYLISNIPKGSKSDLNEREQLPPEEVSEEWMGIFIKNQRIGYSFTKIAKFGSGLEVENKSQMKIFMMQEVTELTTNFYAHTDTNYALKDFSMEIITSGHPAKVEGKIEEGELLLTTYSQGIKQTQKRPLKERPFFPDAIEQVIKKKNLKPGDEIAIPYFDPTTQSQSNATLKVFPPEKVRVLDKELSGIKIEINFLGMVSYLYLDENYRVIKEETPNLQLEMIPLSKEEALSEIKPEEAFDLLGFFSVKLSKTLPIDREISYLKIELKNISPEGLELTDDYQRLISENPILIESFLPVLNKLEDYEIPISNQEEFLKPSAYIQSDHPEIIAEARRIVGKEKRAVEVVKKLTDGVYRMLRKNPTPSLPTAIDVLKTKEGDCNEHSILFAALARAVGIPTKVYVGLVNLYGDAYFYHAWCAVWLGKWIPVDPTFNQFPANVLHLKLKEGEISDWAQVMKVVGKLEIKVLEYK
uniref:Transglutaminase family protein n=1 Tax=candidate division WOR-3 bacterium TaxID=2052148 RepID=A0A7C4TEW2_UNCW3